MNAAAQRVSGLQAHGVGAGGVGTAGPRPLGGGPWGGRCLARNNTVTLCVLESQVTEWSPPEAWGGWQGPPKWGVSEIYP